MTQGGIQRERPSEARPSEARPSAGFSLVELLVVIVIIGILIALLIPVLGIARASVQEAGITTEVATLSQGLEAFNTEFNAGYPPDFSGPIIVNGPRQLVAPDAQAVDQFLTRLFRYRNRATDVPRDPATGMPLPNGANLFASLDPSEALVFWLRGFTDDPANPLFGPVGVRPDTVQRTPIFEFDPTRLIDKDGDGFMEYYPRFASDLPYVYLAHYNYVGAFQQPSLVCRTGVDTNAAFPCPRPYLAKQNAEEIVDINQVNDYAAAQKFQVLAAGLDNDFGIQQDNSNYNGFTYPLGPYPNRPHQDNITNFAEGSLEGKLP